MLFCACARAGADNAVAAGAALINAIFLILIATVWGAVPSFVFGGLVLAASPLYLHTFGTPKVLEDLSAHQCIVAWRGGSSLSWRLKNVADQEHRFQPKAFHQISDGDAMVAACVAGAGIIQFPQSLLRPYLDNGTLLQILTELTPSPTELNIIWPRTKQLMPAVRFIVDELVQLSDAGTFS